MKRFIPPLGNKNMALKKDKVKILGEVFDDARIRQFLSLRPPSGINKDFHLLEKAYRGMNADNFASFVTFFCTAGFDVNAVNPEGNSLLQIILQHGGGGYAQHLLNHGAQV